MCRIFFQTLNILLQDAIHTITGLSYSFYQMEGLSAQGEEIENTSETNFKAKRSLNFLKQHFRFDHFAVKGSACTIFDVRHLQQFYDIISLHS